MYWENVFDGNLFDFRTIFKKHQKCLKLQSKCMGLHCCNTFKEFLKLELFDILEMFVILGVVLLDDNTFV